MKKLFIIYMLLIGVFGLYFYYYQMSEKEWEQSETASLSKSLDEKYVMVTFQAGIDYWKPAIKGFEDAAEELGVSVEYRGAPQVDVYEQITVLEQVIARQPAGIAISAVDAARLNATIKQALEADIPIVLFDADAPDSGAASFLGTNNKEAGAAAAHKLAAIMNRKGKTAVITAPGQLNLQERKDGFVQAIESYPEMEVVAVEDGRRDEMTAKQAVVDLLKEHPDIEGFFSTEANAGAGIAQAARVLQKDLHIIGFDTYKRTLDLIKEGEMDAAIAQGTWEMGYQSLHFLVQLYQNPDREIPKRVNTGVTVVTKENVEAYYAW
ncbi:substrate-binding domain-containing protein [Domibacillus sp. A3M-37]|uniref:substrate-binding domain-containing protein n=1 Tax=Domibacillus sp. A3M-37 TaxID=2962037 RepID=UPI0020B86D1B|nr:substrate-binding domain-containing protein [Domibacillus sp. A3M-37]MCP3763485.1 substrate-binding domain-containing protein [Domibacillus sp. A3M-37]